MAHTLNPPFRAQRTALLNARNKATKLLALFVREKDETPETYLAQVTRWDELQNRLAHVQELIERASTELDQAQEYYCCNLEGK